MSDGLSRLLNTLANSPDFAHFFNPWAEMDHRNDIGPAAPEIRKKQLAHYLQTRFFHVIV